ncbi:Solute carrier 2, facilitated glucose transporter member 5, partial [Coemansia sp. IMI 209127]
MHVTSTFAWSTQHLQHAGFTFLDYDNSGVSSTVVATYNSECAPQRVRGLIGVVLQLSVEVGIFLAQIAAIVLVDVPNWRILFGLSGAISLVQLVWLPFMPESPLFLARHGDVDAAMRTLQRLRPNYDVTNELLEMIETHAPNSGSTPSTAAGLREGFVDDSSSDNKADITETRENSLAEPATNERVAGIGIT